MTILAQRRTPALPRPEVEAGPGDYVPSDLDLAWDTGFTIAKEGGAWDPPSSWGPEKLLRYCSGKLAGRKARLDDEARERAERDRLEASFAEYDAWLDSLAADREAEAFASPITDADIYRRGGVS